MNKIKVKASVVGNVILLKTVLNLAININRKLCYKNEFQWSSAFRSASSDYFISDNMPKKHTLQQVLKSLESVTPSKRTRISFPPIKEQKNNLISSCYKLSPWISLNHASVYANCVYNKLRYNVFKIFSWLSITQPIKKPSKLWWQRHQNEW